MFCNFYIEKSKRNCKRQAKEQDKLSNKLYCKLHYNLLFNNNTESKNEESKNKEIESNTKSKKNSKIEYNKCIFLIKSENLCNKKALELFDNNYYCKVHYNTIIKLKSKEITNKINNIKKMSINNDNRSIIKKDIYKILLEIHPDKCKIPNINSHELTQQLTNILNKLKI